MQGNRIKEAMQSRGWRMADLCRLLNEKGYSVTEASMSAWFSGATKNIKAEYLFAIEDLTGYRARWLAEGSLPKIKYKSDFDFYRAIYERGNQDIKHMIENFFKAIDMQQKQNQNAEGVTNDRVIQIREARPTEQ